VTDCFHEDEVELRAHTNIALQQNIDFITLCQWYNIFNVAGLKEVYLKPPPGVKNARGSAFCLKLFIHKDAISFLPAFICHPIVALSADPIHFQQTIYTISTNDGQYSFTESSTIKMGFLDQNTMFLPIADCGKTNDVYGASCVLLICEIKLACSYERSR
jgi:hypothetical protein